MVNKKEKKTVFVDLDDTACNFSKQVSVYKSRFPNVIYPQSQTGFFSTMEPVSGFLEAWNTLSEYYDLRFLTRPSIYNLSCYGEKAQWVRDNVGDGSANILEKLNICPDKSIVVGDYLIDDWDIHGQTEFKGEFIHFGRQEGCRTWKEVTEYLLHKAGVING